MKKDREIRKSIKTVVMVENLVKGSEGKEDERIFLKGNLFFTFFSLLCGLKVTRLSQ